MSWNIFEHPLDVAKRLGFSVAGNLGAEAFVELELAYASGLLPKFKDNHVMRVRQNVLLYWDQSYFKTTTINEFAKTIPDDLGVVDITSMSPQMIFGSLSEDRKYIVRPAFAGKRFALITELLSFIGSGNTMKDIVNTMNKVMEGERVTRQLLKFGKIDFDSEQIEKLKQKGIFYDPYQAQLSYRPDVCILAASRPMDNRTYTYLRSSGHLYRYHIIQHEIDDLEAEQYLVENYSPDVHLQKELKALNEQLKRVSIKDLRMPSMSIMQKVTSPLVEIVKDEITSEKRRLSEIIDMRTKGDIMRELTAHAFIRTAHTNGFRDIERLEYTEEDLEFILSRLHHFVEFKLNPLFAEEWTVSRIRKKRPREYVQDIILEFLKDKSAQSSRNEIIQYVKSKMDVSTPTIDNCLRELLGRGVIYQPRYGYYKLGKAN